MNSFIARTIAMYTVVEFAAKGFGFLVTIHLANKLAPGDFGILGFVWAMYSCFVLLAQAGLHSVGEREVARGVMPIPDLSGAIFSLRLLFSLISFLVLVLMGFSLERGSDLLSVLVLQGCSILLVPFQVHYLLRGRGEVKPLIISQVCQSSCLFILIWLTVDGSRDLLYVPLAFFLGTLSGIVPLLPVYCRLAGSFRLRNSVTVSRTLLQSAFFAGASGLMIQAYYSLDVVMLGLLEGEEMVGIYTAAHKVMMVLLVVPGIILSSYLPSLASCKTDTGKVAAYIDTMAAVGIPFGFAGLIAAPWAVQFLYGVRYAGAVLPLQILLFNVSMACMAMAFANPIYAWGNHRAYFRIVTTGALANLVLNFILIPPYGLTGAAVATLLSEGAVVLRAKRELDRKVQIPLAHVALPPLAAAGTAWLFSVVSAQVMGWGFPGSFCLFIIAYGTLMYATTRRGSVWTKGLSTFFPAVLQGSRPIPLEENERPLNFATENTKGTKRRSWEESHETETS